MKQLKNCSHTRLMPTKHPNGNIYCTECGVVLEFRLSFPRGMGKTHANKKAKEYIQNFLDEQEGRNK